jgi:hypothetical protein
MDLSQDEWVGDELPPRKASGSTRVYFVNANGIWYGARGGEMNEVFVRVLEGNIDITGHNNAMCGSHVPSECQRLF